MSDAVRSYAEVGPRSRADRVPLPLVMFLAPVAWFAHLSAGMVLGPAACDWGTEIPLHLMSVAAIAVALVGVVLLVRRPVPDDTTRLLVRIGLGLAALSLLAIVLVAVIVVPIDSCPP